MIQERESPGRDAIATQANSELSRTANLDGRQTELRSLRDALWEAINGIEEKAPDALIERELVILDRVADALTTMMCEPDAATIQEVNDNTFEDRHRPRESR